MATIAPWLKGPDVLEAMTKGANVGQQRANLKEQARANTLRHMAAMAGVQASRVNQQERAKLAAKQMENQQSRAAADLLMQRAGLDQRAELAQMKAAEDLNRPRYMSVSGGVAQIGPDGQPVFTKTPWDTGYDLSQFGIGGEGGEGGGQATTRADEINAAQTASAMEGGWDAINMLTNTPSSRGAATQGRPIKNKMTMGGNPDPARIGKWLK